MRSGYLLTVLFVALLFSCGKKGEKATVRDRSYAEALRLNQVRKQGNHLFICGGERFSRSLILRMDSAGMQAPLSVPLPSNSVQKEIFALSVRDDGHMAAAGMDGGVFVSADRGSSWNFIQHSRWKEFHGVALPTADSIVLCGGKNFETGYSTAIGFSGGQDFYRWDERNFECSDLCFTDSLTGYMAGYGALLKTTDGARSWTFTGAKGDFFKALAFRDAAHGMVVGYNGSMLRTDDAGQTWTTLRNGNKPGQVRWNLLALAAGAPGQWVAGGEKGLLVYTNDDGKNFMTLDIGTQRGIRGVCFLHAGTVVVVGEEGLVMEVDLP
jgi:photosystem II stability/assembly factor-like uncharacterized protein